MNLCCDFMRGLADFTRDLQRITARGCYAATESDQTDFLLWRNSKAETTGVRARVLFFIQKREADVCPAYKQRVRHNLGTYLLLSDNDLDSQGNDQCFRASGVAIRYPDNRLLGLDFLFRQSLFISRLATWLRRIELKMRDTTFL